MKVINNLKEKLQSAKEFRIYAKDLRRFCNFALRNLYFKYSYCDITTGENYITEIPLANDLLNAEILKLKIKEIVIGSDFNKNIFDILKSIVPITISIEENTNGIDYLQGLSEGLDKNNFNDMQRDGFMTVSDRVFCIKTMFINMLL